MYIYEQTKYLFMITAAYLFKLVDRRRNNVFIAVVRIAKFPIQIYLYYK